VSRRLFAISLGWNCTAVRIGEEVDHRDIAELVQVLARRQLVGQHSQSAAATEGAGQVPRDDAREDLSELAKMIGITPP